ncbi:hypothetical protein K2173_028188 [Erythroxylum novogranatense]|uniref:Pentatricopeptide repeat-containing protein n=1 Tax=Erythroxylum novogranatense TaxID=1862640 RepID=A0AAV8U2G4_9ROSI|nr:hypothetical protein K2173_028188 [Erythroxylum novogranatense]
MKVLKEASICLFRSDRPGNLLSNPKVNKHKHALYSTLLSNDQLPKELQEVCRVVSSSIGGLDDLESSLNQSTVQLTSAVVRQVLDSCKQEAPSRRLLRFFSWSCRNLSCDIKDEDSNFAVRVLAEKKDHTGLQILLSDLRKEGRAMEAHTFSVVAETLVTLGKEDEALGIFKNLGKFKCPQDSLTVTAIVSALCSKGHAKKALGVIWHHKDKISSVKSTIYKCLLHGWSVQKNVKEARNVIQQMKANGISLDLLCFNTFLRCLCERNVRWNPSGLLPEALNVMMEMRSYKIMPNSISYNILLSYLGRTRRVKESCQVLEMMRSSGCAPDWTTYYLVAKVLYLSGRVVKGNRMVNEMTEEGLVPNRKFYYDLIGILCGVERIDFALGLFDLMKRSSMGGYGPVYDVLIPKLCRGGDFQKGRELWDEAMAIGITLSCSEDVLDPSVTEVFQPKRKEKEEVRLKDFTKWPKTPTQAKKTRGKLKRKAKPKKKPAL